MSRSMRDAAFDGLSPEDFDRSADPAADFYRFANGGWLDRTTIPDDEARFGAFEEVARRTEELLLGLLGEASRAPDDDVCRAIGAFFASGLDEETRERRGLAPIADLLAAIDRLRTPGDLPAVLAALRAAGVSALLTIEARPDFEDPDRTVLSVGQGGLGLPERDDYLRDDEKSRALRARYREHLARLLAIAGEAEGRAERAADDVLEFETALARRAMTPVELRDPTLTSNRWTSDRLAGAAPTLDPLGVASRLGARSGPFCHVAQPDFVEGADAWARKAPIAALRAYLRVRVLAAYAPFLTRELYAEHFDFRRRHLHGVAEPKPAEVRVLRTANAEIGELVGRRFVELHFPPAAKERCVAMVRDLVGVLRERLASRPWMTAETRRRAVAKLDRLRWKIGYPDRWRDFSSLRLDRRDYAGNVRRARELEARRRFARVGGETDRTEWFMPPQTVNAYYHPLLHEIVFPAGILQPPFFHADYDDALNFGGMGAVIGHEITHAFDDAGSRYDEKGRYREWWTARDRAEFERRAETLVRQAEAMRLEGELAPDGRLTLGENIADLGGLTLAYEALRRRLEHAPQPRLGGFTPEQRFFLAWARIWRSLHRRASLEVQLRTNPHLPGPLRAVLPLRNFEGFARAFGLPADAPLRAPPEERCEIW